MAGSGPSTRTLVRVFFTFAALAALLYLLYLIQTVVILVGTAGFLAVALGPAVGLLVDRGLPRGLSILAIYIALVLGIFGIGLLFVPSLVSGVQSLANDAPGYVDKLRKSATFRRYDNRYGITDKLKAQAAALPAKLGTAATTLSDITVGVFSAIVKLITVLTVAFFLLLDGERLLEWAFDLLPPERARRARGLAERIYHAVGGYVAGNLAISLIAGLVAFVTLLLLGVPFALPLAVLMGFFDLIPLVGATIGAIIVGLVTLFNGFPTSTIIWAIVQIAYQQVESNVIFPVVYRRTVQVNGLITIIAVLIGGTLLGILGALIAIPIAGALQIIAQELWRERRRRLESQLLGTDSLER